MSEHLRIHATPAEAPMITAALTAAPVPFSFDGRGMFQVLEPLLNHVALDALRKMPIALPPWIEITLCWVEPDGQRHSRAVELGDPRAPRG